MIDNKQLKLYVAIEWEGDVPMNVEIGSGQRRWGHG
jgi:hypothetical protein